MTTATTAGRCISLLTESTTSAFTKGQIVCLDTSGNVVAVPGAESRVVVGVIAKGRPATSSAEQLPVSVQVSGVADVLSFVADTDGSSGYDAPIVPGEGLMVDASARAVAFDGTGETVSEPNEIGEKFAIALEANAGSTEADVTAYIKVLLLK